MDKIKKRSDKKIEDSLKELNEKLKNYNQMNDLLCEFVYDVQRKTRLAWRYFGDMVEAPTEQPNRYNVVRVTLSEEGDKVQHLATLVDGYYLDTEDMFSIEDILYRINGRAIELHNSM